VKTVTPVGSATYDGVEPRSLAATVGVPRAIVFDSTSSTLDVAHELGASGAPSGTLVLADMQTAGRGRGGKRWASAPGAGLWLTLVERDVDAAVIDLLALRLGLVAASALDRFAGERIMIKWPNDLFTSAGKLAGILVEARWRDGLPEWVAVGMGVNVRLPDAMENAAALRTTASRIDVLRDLVPALRGALERRGALTPAEREALDGRDMARGRRITQPGPGIAEGMSEQGELLVRSAGGTVERYRAGSLVFAEES
jgi:BirA family biotin operon repressor/biotin-[acetyl-CoA-carboxylase] ligase